MRLQPQAGNSDSTGKSQARLDGVVMMGGKASPEVAASGEEVKPDVDLLVGSLSCLNTPPPIGPA